MLDPAHVNRRYWHVRLCAGGKGVPLCGGPCGHTIVYSGRRVTWRECAVDDFHKTKNNSTIKNLNRNNDNIFVAYALGTVSHILHIKSTVTPALFITAKYATNDFSVRPTPGRVFYSFVCGQISGVPAACMLTHTLACQQSWAYTHTHTCTLCSMRCQHFGRRYYVFLPKV